MGVRHRPKKSTTNTGRKILVNPKIAEITNNLILQGMGCSKIARILSEQYNYKVSDETVRAYFLNCFRAIPKDDELKLQQILMKLVNSVKLDEQKNYITEQVTYVGFLKEVLSKLNEEIQRISKLQVTEPDASNAMAITNMLKLMVNIRTDLETKISAFDANIEKIMDRIFVAIIEFFDAKVVKYISDYQKKELAVEMEKLFTELEQDIRGFSVK